MTTATKPRVTKHTRAGYDGRPIQCPRCGQQKIVYHFCWVASECRNCGSMVPKLEYLLVLALLALLALLAGCADHPRLNDPDGGPGETLRFCASEDECGPGETCASSALVPIPHCRDGRPDAQVGGDAAIAVDAGSDAHEPDAYVPPTIDAGPTCWADRNIQVSYERVGLPMQLGAVTCPLPASFGTTLNDGCVINAGFGTESALCERLDGTYLCADTRMSTLEGASLFRMPVAGDTITQTTADCITTWRVTSVNEGTVW